MAWLDERAWCHPKLVDLTDRAFRVWVNGISYSAGMGTRGNLSPAQQRLLGGAAKVKAELIDAGLWRAGDHGFVLINDWDEHNGKRDDRRAADRERKRQQRKSARPSAGQSRGRSTGTARVEGSEGSDGSEQRTKALTLARQPDLLWDALVIECGDVETSSSRGKRNAAVKQLRDIGATAEDIHRKAAAYRERWPNVDITDTALVKHWSHMNTPTPTGQGLGPAEILRLAKGDS